MVFVEEEYFTPNYIDDDLVKHHKWAADVFIYLFIYLFY